MIKFLVLAFITGVSVSAFASANRRDKVIYDALNAQEIVYPTVYPNALTEKAVGRLTCTHTVNVKTQAEAYKCVLNNEGDWSGNG